MSSNIENDIENDIKMIEKYIQFLKLIRNDNIIPPILQLNKETEIEIFGLSNWNKLIAEPFN